MDEADQMRCRLCGRLGQAVTEILPWPPRCRDEQGCRKRVPLVPVYATCSRCGTKAFLDVREEQIERGIPCIACLMMRGEARLLEVERVGATVGAHTRSVTSAADDPRG